MPKIILEREKCIGCGSCIALCPKHFEIIDDGKSSIKNAQRDPKIPKSPKATGTPAESLGANNDELEINKIGCIQEAADSCPVQCIHIVK